MDNRIVKAFDKAFLRKGKDEWDKIYITIDVHDTILMPKYGGVADTYCDHAKEVLQYLTDRKDIVLIMWTCSTKKDCLIYFDMFIDNGIKFNYINDNPESDKFNWGDYSKKMYTNVLLDDKAGFEAYGENSDWLALKKYFNI